MIEERYLSLNVSYIEVDGGSVGGSIWRLILEFQLEVPFGGSTWRSIQLDTIGDLSTRVQVQELAL